MESVFLASLRTLAVLSRVKGSRRPLVLGMSGIGGASEPAMLPKNPRTSLQTSAGRMPTYRSVTIHGAEAVADESLKDSGYDKYIY